MSPVWAQTTVINSDTTWSGPGDSWSGKTLNIAGSADATLNIVDGAEVRARGTPLPKPKPGIQIGNATGRVGVLNVSGSGSLVDTSRLGVGAISDAKGTVTVEQNAHLIADTLNVGFRKGNIGIVNVNTGGSIASNTVVIGINGTGTATIDGGESLLDANKLFVGRQATGNGTLNIVNGGTVSAGAAAIGLHGKGEATVQGAGSNLSVIGELQLGQLSGPGSTSTLTISDHGVVSSGFVNFGTGTGTINLDADGVLATGQIQGHGGADSLNFDGGTLRLTQDQSALFTGLSAGSIVLGAGGGIFDTQDYDIGVVSDIGGAGALTKLGAGTLRFMVPQAYGGDTFVNEGTLAAGAANVFAPGSDHYVLADGILHTGDFDQTLQYLENAGTVSLAGGTAGNVLTTTGDYRGNGGTIELDTVLGDDASLTDRFVVQGDSLGSGNLRIDNAGGGGAQTSNGIKVIDVTGASTGSFSLLGDYVHQGAQAVVGGAYAYKLYQGGKATPGDGDWYLRSELITPTSVQPLYQIGVPVYETYPQALLGLNALPTWRQRVGNRFGANSGPGAIWGRIVGSRSSTDPRVSTSGSDYDQNAFELQIGKDAKLAGNGGDILIGSLAARYANGSASTRSVYGDGNINTAGFGVGGALTWYDDSGFYLDAQGQVTWYDSDLEASPMGLGLVGGNDGFGYAVSLEAGRKLEIGGGWSLTPQAQLSYSNVHFDGFTDTFGASVALADGNSLRGRLGLALGYENTWRNEGGHMERAQVYGVANLYKEFAGKTSVDVSGTRFSNASDRVRGELGLGGSYAWDDGKYSIHGQGTVSSGLDDVGDSYAYKGQIGFRMRW